MLAYLLDENVDPDLRRGLLRRELEMVIWRVGEAGTVPRGTADPDILRWCEENDFLLVTNNRKSMPEHLQNHLADGRHVPGIIFLDDEMSLGQTIEALLLIWGATFPGEYRDTLVYLNPSWPPA